MLQGRGSIPDEVIGFFFPIFLILSAAALWPWGRLSLLKEMSTRNLARSIGGLAGKADNLIAICEPIV
jgi:hypothetical protein